MGLRSGELEAILPSAPLLTSPPTWSQEGECSLPHNNDGPSMASANPSLGLAGRHREEAGTVEVGLARKGHAGGRSRPALGRGRAEGYTESLCP